MHERRRLIVAILPEHQVGRDLEAIAGSVRIVAHGHSSLAATAATWPRGGRSAADAAVTAAARLAAVAAILAAVAHARTMATVWWMRPQWPHEIRWGVIVMTAPFLLSGYLLWLSLVDARRA